MRNLYASYAQRWRHDPKLGSQARCLTIAQDTWVDEDLSGEGQVADKARELVSDFFSNSGT
jgi:hypothetical protein